MTVRPLAAALAVALLVAAGCGDDDDGGASDAGSAGGDAAADDVAGAGAPIVFSTEGNNLNAYVGEEPFEKQTVIPTAADDPDGMDINGQLCFFPDDPHRLIAGEDTGQPERTPGWGIFEIEGDRVGDLSATRGRAARAQLPGRPRQLRVRRPVRRTGGDHRHRQQGRGPADRPAHRVVPAVRQRAR